MLISMTIVEIINNDIKKAMLAREKEKLEALRAIKTALTIASASKGGNSDISDDEAYTILKKLVKQRVDAGEIYKEQNRPDLYESEFAQAEIIKLYLPAQMSENEIEIVIKKIITDCGATSQKEMGKVMGITSKQLQGKADNKIISEIIKKYLS